MTKYVFDREKNKKIKEKVYYEFFLKFLYKKNFISNILKNLLSRNKFFSKFFGVLNKSKISKFKIKPFIKKFQIDKKEFMKKVKDFRSFNDFFIRKLKEDARKIDFNKNVLTFPCDGKFLAFEDIEKLTYLNIKNQKFSLLEFLKDKKLFEKYKNGSMLLARLSPDDYHRFHFPCDCIPGKAKFIKGFLYSVNPIALKQKIKILSENKRMITILKTENFSDILYVEIGATNVGSINQTFFPEEKYQKAEEKGYFSLGGSSIALIFKKGIVKFDQDLIDMTKDGIETKDKFGSRFGIKS